MSYYTASGEPPGQWAGKGAAALGLTGQVDPAVIDRLYQHNIRPGGELLVKRSRALTPELKALIGQYQTAHGKPPSKRTIWLLGQQAAQNTRRTNAEARRTVAGQAGTAEPTSAQRLAAWEAQTAPREVQDLSAVHQEVARFAAQHAGRAPAVLDDAAKRRAARIAVAEVQRHHANWSVAQLRFEVHRALPVLSPGADADAVVTEVATLAVSGQAGIDVVQVTTPDITDLTSLGIRASDGGSIYRPPNEERYCTLSHLDTEQQIFTAATRAVPQLVPVEQARAAAERTRLNAGGPPVPRGLGSRRLGRLRTGDFTSYAAHDRHGRIRGADQDATMDRAASMWLADHLRGKNVLLLAGSNSEAADLSRRVQAKLIQLGTVQRPQAALSDGDQAGTGDLIRARLNTTINAAGRELTNRDTLQITGWHGPHAQEQRREQDGTWTSPFLVPRAYLAGSAELDYAGNTHVGQGRTVDTAHLLVTGTLSRRSLYVGLTRGRESNTAHIVTGTTAPPGHPLYEQASPESVVKAILDRGDPDLSATEKIRHAQDWTGGTGHLLTLWSAAIRHSLYPQIDEQIKARLTESQAWQYQREHAPQSSSRSCAPPSSPGTTSAPSSGRSPPHRWMASGLSPASCTVASTSFSCPTSATA
jgi:hypothetical protein